MGLRKICSLHINSFIVRRLHLLRYKTTFCVQSISNIVLFDSSSLTYQRCFDTVDHELLISRLRTRFGIKGNALRWFESYLQNRKQFVQVDGATSASKELQCGVPQGSVLGPLLYLFYYALPHLVISFEVIIDLSISTPTTANFNISFKTTLDETAAVVSRIEACVRDIDAWMICNKF